MKIRLSDEAQQRHRIMTEQLETNELLKIQINYTKEKIKKVSEIRVQQQSKLQIAKQNHQKQNYDNKNLETQEKQLQSQICLLKNEKQRIIQRISQLSQCQLYMIVNLKEKNKSIQQVGRQIEEAKRIVEYNSNQQEKAELQINNFNTKIKQLKRQNKGIKQEICQTRKQIEQQVQFIKQLQ